jgi:hypothetical protein
MPVSAFIWDRRGGVTGGDDTGGSAKDTDTIDAGGSGKLVLDGKVVLDKERGD